MSSSGNESMEATRGMPRRVAMQGIAGSLAGLAALGAVGASAKKNKKSKASGTLVHVERIEVTDPVPANSNADTTLALCPAPGSDENVFVLGGGFSQPGSELQIISALSVTATGTSDVGYAVTAKNNAATPVNLTAQAICGYFRK